MEIRPGAQPSGRRDAMTNHARGILRVVSYYAGFASLWILVSDRVLEALVRDGSTYAQWSIYKGWAFVVITGALLAVVLRANCACGSAPGPPCGTAARRHGVTRRCSRT